MSKRRTPLTKVGSLSCSQNHRPLELVWSPDGKEIAYQSNNRSLFIRSWPPENGATERQIDKFASPLKFGWSPSGRYFAYFTGLRFFLFRTSDWAEIYRTGCKGYEWLDDEALIVLAPTLIKEPFALLVASTKSITTFEGGLPQAGCLDVISLGDAKFALIYATSIEVWECAATTWQRIKSKREISFASLDDGLSPIAAYAYDAVTNQLVVVHRLSDRSAQVIDLNEGRTMFELQGHTASIKRLGFAGDYLYSVSHDHTAIFWLRNSWRRMSTLVVGEGDFVLNSTAELAAFATNRGLEIEVAEFSFDALPVVQERADVHYSAARVVLLGESGVGKTGLGWRLSHDSFVEHPSTHGRQFWQLPWLQKTLDDGTECDAIIWDLAGQPDYRITHTLYLDDIDVALLLFDAANRIDPLNGVEYWLNHFKHTEGASHFVLVASRIDRGSSTISDAELSEFARAHDVTGGTVKTSAATGVGVDDLRERIRALVDWDHKPRIVTSKTFKALKDHLLALKSSAEFDNLALLSPDEFVQSAQMTRNIKVSDAERSTAMQHLESHGYISVISDVNGRSWILARPELLDNLAASIVIQARAESRGSGSLVESELFDLGYDLPELKGLQGSDARVVLEAATSRFIRTGVCFRETIGNQNYLIFPSLINEYSAGGEHEGLVDADLFVVEGATENVYSKLVIMLGYTNVLVRQKHFRDKAFYKLDGFVCGIVSARDRDGVLNIQLVFASDAPSDARRLFASLVECWLLKQKVHLRRYPLIVCGSCEAAQSRDLVVALVNNGKSSGFCGECGAKFDVIPTKQPEPHDKRKAKPKSDVQIAREVDVQSEVAGDRTRYEQFLTKFLLLKQELRPSNPTCFVSYAWGDDPFNAWVERLCEDLRRAEVDVLFDRWQSGPGSRTMRFIQKVAVVDQVVVVGSPGLVAKYDDPSRDSVVSAELDMISLRIAEANRLKERKVVPILREGNRLTSFTPLLQTLAAMDFKSDKDYFRRLGDLTWVLHRLPTEHSLYKRMESILKDGA